MTTTPNLTLEDLILGQQYCGDWRGEVYTFTAPRYFKEADYQAWNDRGTRVSVTLLTDLRPAVVVDSRHVPSSQDGSIYSYALGLVVAEDLGRAIEAHKPKRVEIPLYEAYAKWGAGAVIQRVDDSAPWPMMPTEDGGGVYLIDGEPTAFLDTRVYLVTTLAPGKVAMGEPEEIGAVVVAKVGGGPPEFIVRTCAEPRGWWVLAFGHVIWDDLIDPRSATPEERRTGKVMS